MRGDMADGALAIRTSNVYGLPGELYVLEEQADALEARLYHGRSRQKDNRVLKRTAGDRHGQLLQTEVSQRLLWTKSEVGEPALS